MILRREEVSLYVHVCIFLLHAAKFYTNGKSNAINSGLRMGRGPPFLSRAKPRGRYWGNARGHSSRSRPRSRCGSSSPPLPSSNSPFRTVIARNLGPWRKITVRTGARGTPGTITVRNGLRGQHTTNPVIAADARAKSATPPLLLHYWDQPLPAFTIRVFGGNNPNLKTFP